MTAPICPSRSAAFEALTPAQLAEIDATPDDMSEPLPLLIPCRKPDGCGAIAGEPCRAVDVAPLCPVCNGVRSRGHGDGRVGGPMACSCPGYVAAWLTAGPSASTVEAVRAAGGAPR